MLFGAISTVSSFPSAGAVTGSLRAYPGTSNSHVHRNSWEPDEMRTILTRAILGLAITTVAAFGADNTIGTWKLNVAKSKYTPAPFPLKSMTVTREAADGGVKQTTTGEQADGTAINASYTAKYDGKDVQVTGNAPYD